ncbi:unnamed protein product [Fraxinus pennsylvanica]|uniref:HMA domain-containing protein n=1 Tax=Fraxinus pennsylvanica TaxID=56036 RepID=A0AAD1YLK1_9LAMI|nr:unnamed protein product [Fraxinus pennsylvanica]
MEKNRQMALQATLIPLKTYSISKAKVRQSSERIQSSIGATQWILSGSSHIEEIEEDYSSLAEAHYEFTPFHELHAHIGSDKELGISLSTKTGSSLIINPTFQKLCHFTEWVQSCTEMLLQTIVSKDYVLINSTTTSCTPQNNLIPIKHILEHLSSTIEQKVEMIGLHERRLRKCLSKLKGTEKVEVDGNNQKVMVTGYAHRNKILKAVRRAGLKADFWSPQNDLLNAYAYGSLRFNNLNF